MFAEFNRTILLSETGSHGGTLVVACHVGRNAVNPEAKTVQETLVESNLFERVKILSLLLASSRVNQTGSHAHVIMQARKRRSRRLVRSCMESGDVGPGSRGTIKNFVPREKKKTVLTKDQEQQSSLEKLRKKQGCCDGR